MSSMQKNVIVLVVAVLVAVAIYFIIPAVEARSWASIFRVGSRVLLEAQDSAKAPRTDEA